MKIHVVGGFLGAGKTTAIGALARELRARGERVALVTNDQGSALVDTALAERHDAIVREIGGGCFCCRYPELEVALEEARERGASVVIAEAVGSCTDLVATVVSPLCERNPGRYSLAPLAIVVDPWRVQDIERGAFHDDVRYLFDKQVEEADVILVSRADANPPDVTASLRARSAGAAVVPVSGTTGAGIAEWLAATPTRPAAPLDLDYERYAAAEAGLGWLNARVVVSAPRPFSPRTYLLDVLGALRELPVAHVKLATIDLVGANAAIVRQGGEPVAELGALPAASSRLELLVNARVATDPDTLREHVVRAIEGAATGAAVTFAELASFAPGRPVPVHRSTYRCGSGDDASCCAAFYERADVRFLLGDSWHPGGVALTLRQGEALGLTRGARVVDVACGRGESLRALVERFGVVAYGVDAGAPRELADVGFTIARGDAHALPFEADRFDAALCECALSTFADARAALLEMRRVLRRGERIAASDMVVEGDIPELLRPYAHQGACLAGARTSQGWRELFASAGLAIAREADESAGLRELLSGIKRRLVGLALGRASGVLGAPDIDVKQARELLREAERVVREGRVRYLAWILESS